MVDQMWFAGGMVYYGMSHVLRQALHQAAVSHGLDAEQVDHLPHGHVLLGHVTEARNVPLP